MRQPWAILAVVICASACISTCIDTSAELAQGFETLVLPRSSGDKSNPAEDVVSDGRRLFSFTAPFDLDELEKEARNFVNTTKQLLTSKSITRSSVTDLMTKCQKFLRRGLVMAQQAWLTTQKFGKHSREGYASFSSLRPYFSGEKSLQEWGERELSLLVIFLMRLQKTTKVLQKMASNLHVTCHMLDEMSKLLVVALAKLELKGVRTTNTGMLVQGVDFSNAADTFGQFSKDAAARGSKLNNSLEILKPVLGKSYAHLRSQLPETMPFWIFDTIRETVPLWRAVEQTGIDMCPHVRKVRDDAQELGCRFKKFLHMLANDVSTNSLSSVLLSCSAEVARNLTASSVMMSCPSKPLANSIVNSLGEADPDQHHSSASDSMPLGHDLFGILIPVCALILVACAVLVIGCICFHCSPKKRQRQREISRMSRDYNSTVVEDQDVRRPLPVETFTDG